VNGQKSEVEVDRGNISNFNSFAYGKCSALKEFPIYFTSTNDMLSILVQIKKKSFHFFLFINIYLREKKYLVDYISINKGKV
jgi:hypothetical protein